MNRPAPLRSVHRPPGVALTALRVRANTQQRLRRGVHLLPSILTVANLFCGYACIVYAMRGEHFTAAPFIGIAIVLDMLDGRIARLTGTSSDFGEEFDSLADIVSFGIAPSVLVLSWGLDPLGRVGWATGFLFVTAAALRLARFNIQAPVADKRYFVGLPSPSAAGVAAATVFASPQGLEAPRETWLAVAMMLALAFLMVSNMRYLSFKTIVIGRRGSYRTLLVIALVMVAIVIHPQIVLLSMAYAYLASGIIAMGISRVRRHRAERRGRAARADHPAGEAP